MKLSKLIIIVITLILSSLFILGILSRSIEVINKNYLWGFDHGREYLMVRDIVVNKNPILIGTPLGAGSAGIQGIFHGPGYYYLLTVPYVLFQGDPYGGVVMMFVFGVTTLIISLLLGLKIFGRVGGLLFATFVSLCPPLIAQSRSIWSPHMSSLFIILSLLFSYQFIVTQKRRGLFALLTAFWGGLIYHFEFAIAVPMTIAIILLSLYVFRKTYRYYFYLVVGFLLAYLPMMLFEVRHNFMAINGILKYLTTAGSAKNEISFIENIVDHFGSFLYNVGNSFPEQTLISASFIFIIIFIPFFYLIRKEQNANKKVFLIWVAILPIVTFAILAFLRNAVYPYYLYHLNFVYLLLFCYVVINIVSQKKYLHVVGLFFIVLAGYFFIQSVSKNIKMMQFDITDYGGEAKIQGKKDAIDFIYKDAKGKEFGLFIFTPPVYTYPYDYLIEWYVVEKYGYKPHREKKGNIYLLMEVDGSKPWSYKGWMETVIVEGNVLLEKKLPSGIIIQKRYVDS